MFPHVMLGMRKYRKLMDYDLLHLAMFGQCSFDPAQLKLIHGNPSRSIYLVVRRLVFVALLGAGAVAPAGRCRVVNWGKHLGTIQRQRQQWFPAWFPLSQLRVLVAQRHVSVVVKV